MGMMAKTGENIYKKIKPIIKIKKNNSEYIIRVNGVIKTGDNQYKIIWNIP